jgi:hypothetical protein
MGDGEHDMIVTHRQMLGAAFTQPLTALTTGATGTKTVTATVVKHTGDVTIGTSLDVTPKRVGVAVLNHLHRMTHVVGKRRTLLIRRIVGFDKVYQPVGRRFHDLDARERAAQLGAFGKTGQDDAAFRGVLFRRSERAEDET